MSDDEKREPQVKSPWIQSSMQDVPAASRDRVVPNLPKVPASSSGAERTPPHWSRILLALAPAIAVLSPGTAVASVTPDDSY